MMSGGEGDENQDVPVPPVGLELEVESVEMLMPELDDRPSVLPTRHRHLPTLPIMIAPFHDARNFGLWLIYVMDDTGFSWAQALFARYSASPHLRQMRRLVAFGKVAFRNFHQLFYLQGLFIIAVSLKHKGIIVQTYRQQLRKFLHNKKL